jgi:hypothetical protein
MTDIYRLDITYTNGSTGFIECSSMKPVYDMANNISYSGGRIQRIVCGERVLWDASWDAESKAKGLQCPL